MREQDLEMEVLEALHAGPEGYRALVREIASACPEYPAERLVAALTRVAQQMDALLHHAGHPTDEARHARELARNLSDCIARTGNEKTKFTIADIPAL
ncbi:hypothetical protein [uncultured Jannaschia sp.]|uniref:hypothetical protein n=1 Tax=uncultured Jannaschia sp. TaxID=293347 RepID=UPI002627172A|nr:hypothetical protein [uncultured Jannaschia sp.]